MKKVKKFAMRFLLLLCVLMASFGVYDSYFKKEPNELTYNEFVKLVEDKEIESIEIEINSSKFTAFHDGEAYIVDNPRDENFKLWLLESDVKVEEVEDNSEEIISRIISLASFSTSILLIVWLFGMMNKNKTGDTFKESTTDITLDQVAGINEIKKDISFLIKYLKDPNAFNAKGAKMPKGVILYGEPGTGKTLLAKAIANEAGVPFYSISGSDFIEMFAGLGAKRVRDLFAKAKKNSPSIVFIDEIDAVGKKRGESNNGERDQTINALLTELDGFSSTSGVLVIAATNRLDDLDSALIRSGRFDKRIKVPLPMSPEERKQIIEIHKKGREFDESVDFDAVAKMTVGFSGADLATLLNESVLDALMNGKEMVDKESVDNAFYKIVLKGHKKSRSAADKIAEQNSIVAYHEAGHALIAKLLANESIPHITIVGTTTGAGGFTFTLPEEIGILTKTQLENRIKVNYGGRAAEVVAGFEPTSGASNDIEQATRLLRVMYSKLGMDKDFILNSELMYKLDSDEINKKMVEESKRLFDETVQFLKENKELLIAVKDALLEKETLDEKALDEVIQQFKK